jgi:hypothetical protein
MADQNGGAPDGATATPAPAAGSTDTTATTTASVEIANPSKGDWAGLNKTLRDQTAILSAQNERINALTDALAKMSGAPPKTEPSKPADAAAVMAEVSALKFQLALKDALSGAGITDRSFAELVEKAALSEKPTDLAAFVARYAPLAPRAAAAPAATAAPPTAPSNTGAPQAAPSSGQLPENPMHWPADTVRKLGPEGFRKALDDYDARTGKGDPLRALRRRRPTAT